MIVLNKIEKIGIAIQALNKRNGRLAISENEYNIFWNYLKNKVNFVGDERYTYEELAKYFDKVVLKSNIVMYRLKLTMQPKDLDKNLLSYLPKNLFGNFLEEAALKLNDISFDDEQQIQEFKLLDEKYQLKLIYELALIEKKKRILENSLNVLRYQTSQKIDIESAEELLENNSYNEYEDFRQAYRSR